MNNMIYQKLYRELIRLHTHLDYEEFKISLEYDIGIINKFIKGDD